ncbi:MAG: DNA internalization-related competence protein ComEC/Rec2 [uncultured Sphingomonas sp.]|uniref:DNA internalization-related competence protein ComEC/Rec2 n=1 Tax=uncultured Sphingomonas sp. TaxID=158754 RepID=A0A6J4S1C2_9SPHN|nr:MAG: DNA internalization-related competence protein ComEC/Rec2 [uncultured Sphingomonas sp.]
MLGRLLGAERGQLPPWVVVGFGSGIAAWFMLGGQSKWAGFLCIAVALALAGFTVGTGRAGRALGWFALAAGLGCALVWARAEWVRAPRLERPLVTEVTGRVVAIDHLAAKQTVRLLIRTEQSSLPPRVRVSVAEKDAPKDLPTGARVQVRARLAPPPPMALPGTYDFSRDAWFKQIGAVGKGLGPPTVLTPAREQGLERTRSRLRTHIASSLPDRPAGIAIALATGDQNSVVQEDAEAMRRSGLTHLLSVSGLHIAAAVAAAMLLTLKLLALSERLALRFNLVLVAAGAGALAGVGYTLLTGAQVPTVRSCVAALLVLAGIALGRDAISIGLIAAGALVVLLLRPGGAGQSQLPDELCGRDGNRCAAFDRLDATTAPAPRRGAAEPGGALAVGHGADRACSGSRADSAGLVPFPPGWALRRCREHCRHSTDDLCDHAAGSGRVIARQRRSLALRCGRCAARRSMPCWRWRTWWRRAAAQLQ